MKTMLEILIRMQQLRRCCDRVSNNEQLTTGEKNSARFLKHLVRECLPPEVLTHYDDLKECEPELLESPEVFAMAVLVSAYRHSSTDQRRDLLAWFSNPSSPAPGMRCNGVVGSRRRRLPQSRRPGVNALRDA